MNTNHNTKSEWTHPPGYIGETWNPVVGCTKVSQGCKHCYAERMAKRLRSMGLPQYEHIVDDQGRWTGRIGTVSQEAWNKPYRWTKPRCIFVNSMTDLFHKNVTFEQVDMVMAMAAICPQHRFLILTKRPARMRKYMTDLVNGNRHMSDALRTLGQHRVGTLCMILDAHGVNMEDPATIDPPFKPFPNVGLGVSVEGRETEGRIMTLLDTPASMRFVSFEPLLGCPSGSALNNATSRLLHWVIAGGESGPGARPCHSAWVRELRTVAAVSGIPFLFKQWGEWLPQRRAKYLWDPGDTWLFLNGSRAEVRFGYLKPFDSGADLMRRVGKANAGRYLDGREYSEWPMWWFES